VIVYITLYGPTYNVQIHTVIVYSILNGPKHNAHSVILHSTLYAKSYNLHAGFVYNTLCGPTSIK